MKGNVVKEIIFPILALTMICLVCSGALSTTYQVTLPTITAAAAQEAELARSEIYPDAGSLVKYEGELPAGVTEIYCSSDGLGYVITAVTKGFGGDIEVMVGLQNGSITGIKVLNMSNETSGLGTQIGEEWYIEKYVGQSKVDGVETIAGATISSSAFKELVQNTLAVAGELGGAKA